MAEVVQDTRRTIETAIRQVRGSMREHGLTPAFTLRVYAHLLPDAADRMRSVIDRAARAEADGPQTAQEAGQ